MVKRTAHLFIIAVTFYVTVSTTMGYAEKLKKYVNNNNGLGKYSFEFETSDGTFRREDGGFVPEVDGESLVVRGEYGYLDTNGRHYVVRYIADANGYQPLQTLNDDTRFNDRRIV